MRHRKKEEPQPLLSIRQVPAKFRDRIVLRRYYKAQCGLASHVTIIEMQILSVTEFRAMLESFPSNKKIIINRYISRVNNKTEDR